MSSTNRTGSRTSEADALSAGQATSQASPDVESLFEPVVGPRAFEEVVDQISFAVLAGRLDRGDRLPTVEHLARAMRVSAPTIGNAIRVLADAGMLHVKRGAAGGITVVSTVVPASLIRLSSRPRSKTLLDLAEARRPVELELAGLAAQRASTDDVARLRGALDMMRSAAGDLDVWSTANYKFHHVIGEAARSTLLAYFQSEVFREIATHFEGWTPRDAVDPQKTIDEHVEILEAIEAGDPDGARAAMDRHLRELETTTNESASAPHQRAE